MCQRLIEENKEKDFFLGFKDTLRFENYGQTEVSGVVVISSAFNPNQKFAQIKQTSTIGFTYIHIVDLKTDSTLILEKIWWGNYVGDTIIDCNNDGYQDYILKVMASSGCCPREESWIYLYNPKTKQFEEAIDVLNAEYFPKEKMVIGSSYGQPNETHLYKLKFNGLKVDTISVAQHQ